MHFNVTSVFVVSARRHQGQPNIVYQGMYQAMIFFHIAPVAVVVVVEKTNRQVSPAMSSKNPFLLMLSIVSAHSRQAPRTKKESMRRPHSNVLSTVQEKRWPKWFKRMRHTWRCMTSCPNPATVTIQLFSSAHQAPPPQDYSPRPHPCCAVPSSKFFLTTENPTRQAYIKNNQLKWP